jgi:bifunctional UDP-N-acetylglucosamine pyrophosphorylase/glucosamine-1-phosphate N-acetyltransferase
MKLAVVVLAAGQGKRMHSELPKVLHRLAGRPLLAHVLAAARMLDPERILVVHGHGGAEVRVAFDGERVEWIEQAEQRGTGHALAQASSPARLKPARFSSTASSRETRFWSMPIDIRRALP